MDSQAIVNTMEVLETKPISELVTEATLCRHFFCA